MADRLGKNVKRIEYRVHIDFDDRVLLAVDFHVPDAIGRTDDSTKILLSFVLVNRSDFGFLGQKFRLNRDPISQCFVLKDQRVDMIGFLFQVLTKVGDDLFSLGVEGLFWRCTRSALRADGWSLFVHEFLFPFNVFSSETKIGVITPRN